MDYLAVFLLGLVLGSFYNVLIYRLPRNISVVFPSSHCPECKERIRWYDNIPILSYLVLRGRCRRCGARISIQYPLVELSSGLLALYSYFRWGFSPEALVHYLFFSALLVVSLIDLKFFILPDLITVPGIALGLLSSFLRSDMTPVQSVTGALLGFFIPLGIYLYYVRFRKMEGLGFGDVKLLAFIGSVTGVYGVFSALFLGSILGLLFALPTVVKHRSTKFVIPFGPFLSLGCFVGIVLKDRIVEFFFTNL